MSDSDNLAVARVVYDLADQLVQLHWFAERQWCRDEEEMPPPEKVALDAGAVVRQAQDLAARLAQEPIVGGATPKSGDEKRDFL